MEQHNNFFEQGAERLQFLTDGVFAIVMTLLVLELHVPELGLEEVHTLPHALSLLLPNISSFVLSFVLLGFFWSAHHSQFRYIKKVDHKLTWLNLFYLLVICFIPFSAALLGRYYAEQIAILVYASNLLVATLFHYAMWRHAARNNRLVDEWVDTRLVRFGSYISYYSVTAYLIAILLSFWDTTASVVVLALVPIPFIAGLFYRIIREAIT